jgi:hypothetical protein
MEQPRAVFATRFNLASRGEIEPRGAGAQCFISGRN